MSVEFDLAIIGGGIVGLAAARAISQKRPDWRFCLLEKEPTLAAHQTGHNSGVIHAGLYYRPGSDKARLCALGRQQLYDFCRAEHIPHRRCGKLVVATNHSEVDRLRELTGRGQANGLEGVEWLDAYRLKDYEPQVAGVAGLWVPETGVVDYADVVHVIAGQLREGGAELFTRCKVQAIDRTGRGFVLRSDARTVRATRLVNCAGLHSDRIARMAGVRPKVRIIPFRGEYYHLRSCGADLVRGLIYPVPDPGLPFLGVHLTRALDGSVEAGPNAVLALAREGYGRWDFSFRDLAETLTWPGFRGLARRFWNVGFNEYRRSFSKRLFRRDLQRLVPALQTYDLGRQGSGVRAQAVDLQGNLVDDFVFEEGTGMVHVLNAPSPAATASLAIGAEIADRLLAQE